MRRFIVFCYILICAVPLAGFLQTGPRFKKPLEFRFPEHGKIVSIAFETRGASLLFSYENGLWLVSQNYGQTAYPAPREKMERLLAHFQPRMPLYVTEYAPDSTRMAHYGLDLTNVTAVLLKTENKTYSLALGARSPNGRDVYTMHAGSIICRISLASLYEEIGDGSQWFPNGKEPEAAGREGF